MQRLLGVGTLVALLCAATSALAQQGKPYTRSVSGACRAAPHCAVELWVPERKVFQLQSVSCQANAEREVDEVYFSVTVDNRRTPALFKGERMTSTESGKGFFGNLNTAMSADDYLKLAARSAGDSKGNILSVRCTVAGTLYNDR